MAADSNNIGRAIEEWVQGLPFEGGGSGPGILGDWMAIACMVDVDAAGHPVGQYYVAMKDGNLLPHVAKGLMVQADEEINGMGQDAE